MRAITIIPCCISYEMHLNECDLTTSETTRLRYIFSFNEGRNTRGHVLILVTKQYRLDIRQFSFS